LIEPQVKHTEVLKVLGTDGKAKMSKSLNNHIELASTPEETSARVKDMVTDPARMKRTDPGNPDVCNVFSMHRIFSPQDEVDMINTECRRAGIGCVDCKKRFAANLNKHLEPFRTKRAELASRPGYVTEVLNDGASRARVIAQETMREVREAMQLP
jgi:tryptophanyl-tRNA synthetase